MNFVGWLTRRSRSRERSGSQAEPGPVAAPGSAGATSISGKADLEPASPARADKLRRLLECGPDETRRKELDASDRLARETNTFGSKQHRAERDRIEEAHRKALQACERLSEDELDRALAERG